MASVSYRIKKSKGLSNIQLRLRGSRALDVSCSIDVHVHPKNWNTKREEMKTFGDKKLDEVNESLRNLKSHIIREYNVANVSGKIVDHLWLKISIDEFFDRKVDTYKRAHAHEKYLYDFAENWLDEESPYYIVRGGSPLSQKAYKQYKSTLPKFKEFEEGHGRVVMSEIQRGDMQKFVDFLAQKEYAKSHIQRTVKRMTFFCARAEEMGLKVGQGYKAALVYPESKKPMDIYLNLKEVQLIHDYDFSYNERLDNARDLFLIGLWTGLRVSDLLTNLDVSNINNGYINIKMKKTSKFVTIPVLPMLDKVLKKRNGELPRKISDVKFNKYIKEICFIVGIDQVVLGSKMIDGRKKVGMYPKYELVTSHICRRSMATNTYEVTGSIEIAKNILGHANVEMTYLYLKKSGKEYADQLRKNFEKVEQIINN